MIGGNFENFVAFSEYMNIKTFFSLFFIDCRHNLAKTAIFNFSHRNCTFQDFRYYTG